MVMSRSDDNTNAYTFAVSSEGDGEVSDADMAKLLSHGLQALMEDA